MFVTASGCPERADFNHQLPTPGWAREWDRWGRFEIALGQRGLLVPASSTPSRRRPRAVSPATGSAFTTEIDETA